jgi:transcription initiation factor TFIIH subunit 1
MKSCHNAATEFLRQYWAAILPTPSGALGTGTSAVSAKTKTAKAAKMAGYLSATENKVKAIVHAATTVNVDPARVEAVSVFCEVDNSKWLTLDSKALAPTLQAVKNALRMENKRVATEGK